MLKHKKTWKTTEFWKSAAVIGCGAFAFVWGLVKGNNDAMLLGGGMMGVTAGAYTVGRSIVKASAPN